MGGASNNGGSPATGGGLGGMLAGSGGITVACMPPVSVTGTAATVAVNLAATPLATVGANFMGVCTAVYDGNAQNATVPPLLKAAGVTALRYPGGSIGDVYHWETNTTSSVQSTNNRSGDVYVAPGADFGGFISLLEKVGANAMITVNYGTNPAGTGPGVPQEAAAWVAYANGDPASTKAIGMDSTGQDWKTVGYWATLRASAPLPVDDGQNFLRINHPASAGIKYWEIGNELYGNGYYYGDCGWEADLHLPVPADPTPCPARQGKTELSPATYGMGVKAFAAAMKAADPTVKVGGVVHWPYGEYADWNGAMLPQACSSIDFVVNHWYAGSTLNSLLTIAHTDIPSMYRDLRVALTTAANGCGTKGATLPIAVTEWGVNTYGAPEITAALVPPAPGVPTHTQYMGIFAAESFVNFMEQSSLTALWQELHGFPPNYLGADDSSLWGHHGALMANYLAGAGDALLPATLSNAGALMTVLFPHASRHADGSVSVMLTNTSPTATAAVTVNVTGGSMLGCVGTRYAYTPVGTDNDGTVTSQPIFSSATGASVSVGVPPFSVVVVTFPKR